MRLIPARFLSLAAVPLMAVAVLGCDIVNADFGQLGHDAKAEWRRSYTLDQGGSVVVRNVNGKIRVERSSNNVVEIVAEKVGRGASESAAAEALDRIEIEETASSSAVRVETSFRRDGPRRQSWEVTYVVRVPAGADLGFITVNGGVELAGVESRRARVSTTNGGILLQDVSGAVEAATTNGGVTARNVSGLMNAETTNGGIDVEIASLADGGLTLECTNGGIRLRLPAGTKATLSASTTNGGIDTSGMTLQVTESGRRRLEGRLNGGGPMIRMSGTNGGIIIRSDEASLSSRATSADGRLER